MNDTQANVCNPNPYIDHGFDRNGSHNEGEYMCRCRGVTKESLEEELQELLVDVGSQLEAYGEYMSADLDRLIEVAQAVKWEMDNE